MRRCIGYVLRGTFGTILGEHAQIAVCKQLGAILADCINSFGELFCLLHQSSWGCKNWDTRVAIRGTVKKCIRKTTSTFLKFRLITTTSYGVDDVSSLRFRFR